MKTEVYIAAVELVTGYGFGAAPCMDGLFAGRHAFRKITRFPTDQFGCSLAATIPDYAPPEGRSFPEPVLEFLARSLPCCPEEAEFFFASTVGEADCLCNPENRWTVDTLFEKSLRIFGRKNGILYSGACSSSNIAIARAASMIRNRRIPAALVVAFDYVSEFVYSGFASLSSMSPEPARPFDRDRRGLVLGDAAGLLLLASGETVEKYSLSVLGKVTGWGSATDALHVTAPDTEGRQMARAMRLSMGDCTAADIGLVIAHGTGTPFNDEMEIRAVRTVFPEGVPTASTKGGAGHTLAAAGMIQAAAALEVLKRNEIFPQTNLLNPAPGAEGLVSAELRPLEKPRILSLNAGFGGCNAVLMLEACHA